MQAALKKLGKESKTRATFSELQLQKIIKVKEVIVIIKIIVIVNKAKSVNKDIIVGLNITFIGALLYSR